MRKLWLHKISVKLFLITIFTFCTLLVISLYAQDYYYKKTYVITKQQNIITNFSNLSKDLSYAGANLKEISQYLQRYKSRHGIEAIVLTKEGAVKYEADKLTGFEQSPTLTESLVLFQNSIYPAQEERLLLGNSIYSNEIYLLGDGERYNIITANILDAGDVLLAVCPVSLTESPGVSDKYFIYILIISVLACVALSVLFSHLLSKPLVRINSVTKEMAKLNFNTKLSVKGNDELSQLSQSINTLSEKLSVTIDELSLANRRLQADIDKEKALELSRKEFVANVSHELKTPIAIIKGYSDAIKDNIMESKREHYINQIALQSDHMDKLVRDMLDLSSIENGTYSIKPENFDLCGLAENVFIHYKNNAVNNQINLEYTSEYAEYILFADRLKINQVINNFMDNAIRHTPKNGTIHMKIERLGEQGFKFSVYNQGDRLTDKAIVKVWERFYRGDSDRNKRTGGTGLGLSIAAKILELHNMEYAVYNADDGVVFSYHTNY